ncbi:N-acetylmuramoyl-L-alanine amidase [Sporosarcina sp. FSL W8-0480]|uniref:N-acetylmuramoyl-L-alanine amidase family protein n=1 Tax=Sporosarcina sp. FSL W8-0480 TaxID=2954701 RepID=UPI0030DBAD65
MVKIVLDAGHGNNTPGKRTPDGEREWGFNDQVVQACISKLATYENVQVLRVDDPTGETDVPVWERTAKANGWNADVYVAVHHNANRGKWGDWTGVETYVMDSPTVSPISEELARLVGPRIAKAMGLKDRGVKRANFHVLRETKMPAILTEGGFMDSVIDIKALRSKGKLKAQGEALAEVLAVYFKLKPKEADAKCVRHLL